MDDEYRRMIFKRAHNALKTPHHRRLKHNKLEPKASHGMRQISWLGSRMNETLHAVNGEAPVTGPR